MPRFLFDTTGYVPIDLGSPQRATNIERKKALVHNSIQLYKLGSFERGNHGGMVFINNVG